ncbi:MAG: glycosyltransferase, partial [Betaproteobacteria bacterium]
MKTAVVVTTYNRPDALAAALAGYQAQRDTGFELVIADDGSTAATREVVDAFKARADFSVSHVWHEDRGFRAAAIRNRALAVTRADYIIFSDGDCVPAQQFVAQHARFAERGWFVAGNRVLLSAGFTDRVLR